MVSIKIDELEERYVNEDFLRCLSQLTHVGDINVNMAKIRYQDIKKNPNHFIYVVVDKDKDKVVGTATLLIEPKFIHNLGYIGHIEDVVLPSLLKK